MGILDLFTGDSAEEAARQNRALLQQTQTGVANRTNAAADTARTALTTGFGDARTNLGQGYGAATGAINSAAGGALGYLDQGANSALGYLGQARDASAGAYQPLSDLAARYGQGSGLYADALGINGADGTARASGAYTPSLGYENTVNSGIDAIARLRNASGQLSGGNTDKAAVQYGIDQANRDYQGWLDRLSGYNNLELSATGNAAAGNAAAQQGYGTAAANIANSAGTNKAGVATGQGTNLANLASQYYGGMAGLDTAQGGALGSLATNTAGQINAADMNLAPQIGRTFGDEVQADLAGWKNTVGLGTSLAKMAMGFV
jgi:hypothetical protein